MSREGRREQVQMFSFKINTFVTTFSLIVLINLSNRFVMIDDCACLSRALKGILETSLPNGFLGRRGKLELGET